MSYCNKNRLSLLYVISLLSLTTGFLPLSVPLSRTWNQKQLLQHYEQERIRLSALIYGWDGIPEECDSSTTAPTALNPFSNPLECSPAGTVMAQALSYDSDRAGHLARLAVAFSPPERALRLDQLEHVDVICVRNDAVDIQAVICEDGTCVSLSVPVKFPNSCNTITESGDNTNNWDLQKCVLMNIDDLDAQAGSVLSQRQEFDTDDDNSNDWGEWAVTNNLPPWWVTLPDPDSALALDCDAIRLLLNDVEFQPDVKALAQDAMRQGMIGNNNDSIFDADDYRIVQARVALVGPAGILFQVRAKNYQDQMTRLDVAYPFGREIMMDVESLRAAVLGAVAAAQGD